MCGLAGVFGNVCHSDQSVFKQLLILASLRGPHSTGVGILNKEGKADHFKLATNPYEFLNFVDDQKQSTSAWLDTDWHNNQAVMGHGRWATIGKVVDENAHPFVHDHITLMHNGGISNHRYLEGKHNTFPVDSESAAWHLAKHGLKSLIDEARGDYAFTWIDTKENTFNLIRNDSRPLFIAENKYRNTWYYSSEAEMLRCVLERTKTEHKGIWSPTPGTHVRFSRETAKELTLTTYDLPKIGRGYIPYNQYHGSEEYSAGGGTGNFRPSRGSAAIQTQQPSVWPGEQQFWDELKAKRSSGSVQESTKETTKAAGEGTKERDGKVTPITGARSLTLARDYRLGIDFSEHMNYRRGSVLSGFFVKCVFSSPGAINKEFPVRGHFIGEFDDADSLECVIEVSCSDMRPFLDENNEIKDNGIWLSFTHTGLAWDVINNCWQVIGSNPNFPSFELDWATLREPSSRERQSWLMKKNLPVGMIAAFRARNESPLLDADEDDVTTQETDDSPEVKYTGYRGVELTASEFDKQVGHGCQLCSCSLSHKDATNIGWVDSDSPLCNNCSLDWMGNGRTLVQSVISKLH